ncbi:hypothetical protein [Prescottella equi]|uniref:Uncharacterized protein n=1 Tax=Rhodococcus phage REQ3 TaxID=1109714 RepID=G9FHA3_9CAUD|nr:hypothetical protein [Prescottella equi]YP_005087248.1 hypothetical protein RoPhREQ3_gp56 [Rhodococcus phage REQ3]AEV51992.1 hypothetical protein [Rhodococcus phage REQ3]ERN43233.1 hypothetical protein H849_24229 [Prescottella equi NBRC 101255 = C 7]ORL29083.1 hypothetical protein A6I89_02010 [Prescottella equi]QPQ77253.1 hypothetical protein I6H09_24380 [Prescottella equi]SUE04898.1 Uncharacterised protein [Prescottella equi]
MTYPVGPAPDGAYVVGSDYGQSYDEANAMALMTGGVKGAFSGAQDQFKDQFKVFTDGQLALNQRTDLLSPLLDFGSAYMNTNQGFNQTGQCSFSNQIGPMQGCRLSGGRIILDDKGLWDIRCQLWFDFINILTGTIEWQIRVLTPSGNVFSQTRAKLNDSEAVSSTNICSVVVPAPGYQVQAWVSYIAAFRGILGGPDRNRLTVQHISRDTSTGNTGQG